MFLFHTGSIKSTGQVRLLAASVSRFLFHTGSIKSDSTITIAEGDVDRFYSILVRLKAL